MIFEYMFTVCVALVNTDLLEDRMLSDTSQAPEDKTTPNITSIWM